MKKHSFKLCSHILKCDVDLPYQVGKLIFPSHVKPGETIQSVLDDPKIMSIFQTSKGKHHHFYIRQRKTLNFASTPQQKAQYNRMRK